MNFQDVARREIARENRESLEKGMDREQNTSKHMLRIRSTIKRKQIMQNA